MPARHAFDFRHFVGPLTRLACSIALFIGLVASGHKSAAEPILLETKVWDETTKTNVVASVEAERILRVLWGDDWQQVTGTSRYLRVGEGRYLVFVVGSAEVLNGIYEVTLDPGREQKLLGGDLDVIGAFVAPDTTSTMFLRGIGSWRGYGIETVAVVTFAPTGEIAAYRLMETESDMGDGGCGPPSRDADPNGPTRPKVAGDVRSTTVTDADGDGVLDVLVVVDEEDCTTGTRSERTRQFSYRNGTYVEVQSSN